MSRTCRWITLVIILGMVVAVGCSRSPEAKKARHLERGDRFFSQQQYREAIIEYSERATVRWGQRTRVPANWLLILPARRAGTSLPFPPAGQGSLIRTT